VEGEAGVGDTPRALRGDLASKRQTSAAQSCRRPSIRCSGAS
jgi:hypothetical protein